MSRQHCERLLENAKELRRKLDVLRDKRDEITDIKERRKINDVIDDVYEDFYKVRDELKDYGVRLPVFVLARAFDIEKVKI